MNKPPIEKKMVKHVFDREEILEIGSNLAREHANQGVITAEASQVASTFKAKIKETEARIEKASNDITSGFEFREKRCRVEFFPKISKKHFFLEHDPKGAEPVLIEDMTSDDFQTEIPTGESEEEEPGDGKIYLERVEDIDLFQKAGNSTGVLSIGRHWNKWYTALNVKIGSHVMEEVLDTTSMPFVERPDALHGTIQRYIRFLKEYLEPADATGFIKLIDASFEGQLEREE